MPNWCDNELWMYGSKEDLEKIKVQVTNEDGEFDFKKIVQIPDHPHYSDEPLSPQDKELWASPFNWYNWNNENWGTKWNASESEIGVVEDGTLQVWFQTAWAPALAITKRLSQLYPDVLFQHEYIEEGDFFCGIYEVKNGDETENSWSDEPNHENLKKLSRPCVCDYADDEDYLYPDCPREEIQNEQRLVKAAD